MEIPLLIFVKLRLLIISQNNYNFNSKLRLPAASCKSASLSVSSTISLHGIVSNRSTRVTIPETPPYSSGTIPI